MVKYRFSNANGCEILRETHGDKVMAELGYTEGSKISGSALKEACLSIRDRYKCRDVRKELRRVAMLCDNHEVNVERF
jgi:hypothetical protein